MKKYDPLCSYLSKLTESDITLSFTKVEDILRDTLPNSARNHRAWWGNGSHIQAYAWMDAGFRVSEVDFVSECVSFRKINSLSDGKAACGEDNHQANRFIVFDVETPNRYNDRMSAIGVTVIEDGIIKDSFFSYVNPETFFDFFNTQITGINEDTVAGAPAFPELWKTIAPIMGSGILVAHNAVFDLAVLKKCLLGYGIDWKDRIPYCCTVRMGRAILPQIKHSLDVVCRYYGIPLSHHQADSDSKACAEILLRYMKGGADPGKYVKEYRL